METDNTMKYLELRTVLYVSVMLCTIAIIIHVVIKGWLGHLPEYDLISVVVLVGIGSFMLIIPPLIKEKDIQHRLSPYPEKNKKGVVPESQTLYLTICIFLVIGIVLALSGIYPRFDLQSVIYTLISGTILLSVSLMRRNYQEQTGTNGSSGSS